MRNAAFSWGPSSKNKTPRLQRGNAGVTPAGSTRLRPFGASAGQARHTWGRGDTPGPTVRQDASFRHEVTKAPRNTKAFLGDSSCLRVLVVKTGADTSAQALGSQTVGTPAGLQNRRSGGSIPPDPASLFTRTLGSAVSPAACKADASGCGGAIPPVRTLRLDMLDSLGAGHQYPFTSRTVPTVGCRLTGRPRDFGSRGAGSIPAIPTHAPRRTHSYQPRRSRRTQRHAQ